MADSVARKLIVAEARSRNWQVDYIGQKHYFCKITGPEGQSEMFRGSQPLKNSANGAIITHSKDLTLQFVEYLGYKVPAYITLGKNDSDATEFLEQYKIVAVKPTDAQESAGVTVGVDTPEKLAEAVRYARSKGSSGKVIIQQQLSGKLYRLFVINDKLVAAARRKAAEVVGDGIHTTLELIETLNSDPRRGADNDKPIKFVKVSDAKALLGEAGLKRIPAKGEVVRVSALDSVSAGGQAINETDLVHPDWKQAVAKISHQAGLFVCGYDIICDDIASPLENNFLPLLEINSQPSITLHHYPTGGGDPIDIASILLDEVFDIA